MKQKHIESKPVSCKIGKCGCIQLRLNKYRSIYSAIWHQCDNAFLSVALPNLSDHKLRHAARIFFKRQLQPVVSFVDCAEAMVNFCVVPGCSNHSDRERHLTYHSLPLKNVSLLRIWIHKIGRSNLPINSNSRVCSELLLVVYTELLNSVLQLLLMMLLLVNDRHLCIRGHAVLL